MKRLQQLIKPFPAQTDLALLLMRLYAGGLMLVSHGWPKLMSFSEKTALFPDPLGIGSGLSLSLAVFAEVFCSLALVVGVFTRAVVIPLMITMLVAAFIVHADDPFQKKEFALLYLFPYVALFLSGPGRFSIDQRLS